jgi:hypothetical protein
MANGAGPEAIFLPHQIEQGQVQPPPLPNFAAEGNANPLALFLRTFLMPWAYGYGGEAADQNEDEDEDEDSE